MNKEKKEKLFFLIICFVLVLLIYGQTIGGDFVFDDRSIVDYKPILRISNFLQVISLPYWTVEAGLYRPMTLLSYVFNYSLLGEGAGGFHFLNLVLYALSGFLLFLLMEKLFLRKKLAYLTSLLFLVLPIHTEAVANIVGRAEILALLFSLLLFLELLKENVNYWKIGLWFLLAIASKETAIAVLPIAFLIIFLFQKKFRSLPYLFLAGAIYFFARFLVLGPYFFSTNPGLVENPLMFASFSQRIITALKVLTLYLSKTFWPFNLCSDYSYNQIPVLSNFLNKETLIGFFALLFFAISLFVFLKKRPSLSLASAFFVFAFLPVSNLLFPIGTMAGERLMYFPSIGLCILLAEILLLFRRPLLLFFAIVIISFYSWRSYSRNFDWLTEKQLFISAAQCAPNSVLSRSNLGTVYYFEKKYPEAEREILAAHQIYDKYTKAVNNLGLVYWKTGRREEARRQFLRALTLPNPFPGAFENLALMSLEQGNIKEARRWLSELYGGNNQLVDLYLSSYIIKP